MKKRLGDILVDVGIITPEQLHAALEIQKRNGGKLGLILSQLGVINEEVMLAFLGKQCGVPYVSLTEYGDIPAEVLSCLPESVIRYQNLIPIARDGNTVTVVMSDPFNVFAVDDIKLMTGYDVQVAIASEADIKAAIVKYFSHLPEQATPGFIDPYLTDSTNADVPAEQLLNSFLSQTMNARASSVYLEPQSTAVRVRQRIDGQLRDRAKISRQLAQLLLGRFKNMAGLDVIETKIPQEGRAKTRIDSREIDLKISIVPTIFGERLRLDILDPMSACIELEQLGFDAETLTIYKRILDSAKGLVLVCGPFDSGRTTSLYSSLAHLNFPDRDILSIEDPVEFVLPGITQVQVDAHTGMTIPSNLHVFLRQFPDILMLGEIRDHWSARLAVNTALSGRLALTSVSAPKATDAIQHLYDVGIDPYAVSTSLSAVLTQRLMRLTCTECKEAYEIPASSLRMIIGELPVKDHGDRLTLWRGRGCPQCNYTGYAGRTGVFEVLQINDNLRSLIAARSSATEIMESAKFNCPRLLEAAWRKVSTGLSTVEEMLRIIRLSE